jgi:hypothetical protein
VVELKSELSSQARNIPLQIILARCAFDDTTAQRATFSPSICREKRKKKFRNPSGFPQLLLRDR